VYFARGLSDTADGPQARVLVGPGADGPWTDLRVAETVQLERRGADAAAARRLAAALVTGSLADGIAAGEAFLDAARAALADGGGEGRLEAEPRLTNALDPSGYRDHMIFAEHFSRGYKLQGAPVPDVLYELPVSYLGNPASFIGPGDEVPWPSYTRRMDYELELGVVIGREGTDLRPEAADGHVFGFTILNDFSARDIQFREMEGRLGPSKGKHFACAAGPVVATIDELDWRAGLRMQARVNGETLCDRRSDEAIFGLDEVVAWASQGEILRPGWLLGSGTVNGGSTIEIGRELSPGDEVELEIEGLGVLRNRLGQPAVDGWEPAARVPAHDRQEEQQ
jgi:2-keto-4-pentenoate hydratase/2-oxohepta-3-ene-1,7-dioic acid hydratase in catechol pathway